MIFSAKAEIKGDVTIIAPKIKFLRNRINIRLPILNIHEVRQNYILSKKMLFYISAVSRAPWRRVTRIPSRAWCLTRP